MAIQTEPAFVSSPAVETSARAEGEHWRQEVATRVRQHRARRKRVDPNALELDFEAEAPLTIVSGLPRPPAERVRGASDAAPDYDAAGTTIARPQARKIIRFPRQSAAELEVEQAEPMLDIPRITYAPDALEPTPEATPEAEQMELLPSFADIRLDEASPENGCLEELDRLPQPAPLGRRLRSGLVDGAIVLAGLAVFVGPFAGAISKLDAAALHPRPAVLYAAAAGATIWLLFQYLFLVYGARTPGMRAAGLELLTFDGREPSLPARCVRALAAMLSGLSLGLGFFWTLVDEDTLGWHDRISQTYLRSDDRVIR
jgi:uncharacterized RDD family membrane protein YckC